MIYHKWQKASHQLQDSEPLGIRPSTFHMGKTLGALFALALTASILLPACSSTTGTQHQWLEAPGWSRARLLTTTESAEPISPVVDGGGNRYFAVSSNPKTGASLEIVALDGELDSLWRTALKLGQLIHINKIHLALNQDQLEVYWIGDGALYGAVLDRSGDILVEAQLLSGTNPVESYALALGEKGKPVLWFSGGVDAAGIYATGWDEEPKRIIGEGYRPQLLLDEQGNLHAIWVQSQSGNTQHNFYYGQYSEGIFEPEQESLIHSTVLALSSGFFGPKLGMDDDSVFVAWTEIIRTGLDAGDISASLLRFPITYQFEPAKGATPEPLLFPNGYKLSYQEITEQASLFSGPRAKPYDQLVPINSTRLVDLFFANQQLDEMVLAFRARLPYLSNREANQVGLIFYSESQGFSYQLLSFSPGISELPAISIDESKYLHITWLEENLEGSYDLYYATTEPGTKAVLDQLTGEDRLQLGQEIAFGMLSGALLIPFPLFWLMAAMAVVFVTSFLRKANEPLAAPGTLISILLGLVAYFVAKLASLPGLLSYVPFSAWVPHLSQDWQNGLQLGVPLVVGALGFAAAYERTYRRSNRSPLFFFLIYALIDGVLTMAIYGVIFYRAT